MAQMSKTKKPAGAFRTVRRMDTKTSAPKLSPQRVSTGETQNKVKSNARWAGHVAAQVNERYNEGPIRNLRKKNGK